MIRRTGIAGCRLQVTMPGTAPPIETRAALLHPWRKAAFTTTRDAVQGYSLFPYSLFRSYSSICAPSSTTRFGGSPKNEVALRALRDMTENSCSRQRAIPGFLEAISVSRPRK